MGEILQSVCSGCKAQTKLFVGGGMRDCETEMALAAGQSDQKLANALEEGASFRIDRRIAICSDCRKLVVGTRVFYKRKENREETAGGVCPNCKGQLEWPEEITADCPVCGSRLEITITGYWD